jgi:hypothetical protein
LFSSILLHSPSSLPSRAFYPILDEGEKKLVFISHTLQGLKKLSELTNLDVLVLDNAEELSDDGLEVLQNFKKLTTLNLCGCKNITDKGEWRGCKGKGN